MTNLKSGDFFEFPNLGNVELVSLVGGLGGDRGFVCCQCHKTA